MTKLTAPRICALLIIIGTALILYFIMQRPLICTCGVVELWHGKVESAGNSQHISDWYSFSHIAHGLIFYGLSWLAARQWPAFTRWRFIAALALEGAWEIFENTKLVLDRYREATVSWGYSGDSVLNSMSDLTMMSLGFWIASKLGWKRTLLFGIAIELLALWAIRDNLTLNIIMLTVPIDAIAQWQSVGGPFTK